MDTPHRTFIQHEPFAKAYTGRRPKAPHAYDQAVITATQQWPLVKNECQFRATFLLGPSKFSDSRFLGPDLDNLLKRLLDNLKQTIFHPPESDDSFIVSVDATKTKVSTNSEMGVFIEVIPLHTIRR